MSLVHIYVPITFLINLAWTRPRQVKKVIGTQI